MDTRTRIVPSAGTRFTTHRRAALALILLSLTVPTLAPRKAAAQTGPELVRQAMAAQAERLAGVDNVTITQNVMGMDVTLYMETKEVGGIPTLVPTMMQMAGVTNRIPQDQMEADWSSPFQEAWAERTRLEGNSDVGGHPVKVLVIDDFNGLDLPGLPGQAGEGREFTPTLMRLYLDDEDMVIRKMEMTATMSQEGGGSAPIEVTMFMEDYRTVDGYLHPFQTRMQTKGMMGAAGVDQQEMAAQLEELKKQLANMPESQRAMMEGILKPQMEQLEAMMGSGDDSMDFTITVTDLKVNAGPPGGGY